MSGKLNYHFGEGAEAGANEVDGCQQSYFLTQTIDRGINTNGQLHFSFPPDDQCFTDTSQTYICVKFRVFRADGSKLTPEDKVFVAPPGVLSFFQSCTVSLNGSPLPPANLYPFGATLINLLGTSNLSRLEFWNPLGAINWQFPNSTLEPGDEAHFSDLVDLTGGSRQVTFYSRIYHDFLMTCAQLLPPGVKLDITLNRSPDNFILAAAPSADGTPTPGYKLEMESVTMHLKRMELSPHTLSLTQQSLRDGGKLRYSHLSCDVQQVPSGTLVYRWNNVYNGDPLPHTIYVVLVKQVAFYGDLHTFPVYMEAAQLHSFRVQKNGRDVLPENYTFDMHMREDSKALDMDRSSALPAFLGLGQVLGFFSDPAANACIHYTKFLAGATVLAAKINTCGGRKLQAGALDLEIQFNKSPDAPKDRLICICFGQFDRDLRLNSNLNLL